MRKIVSIVLVFCAINTFGQEAGIKFEKGNWSSIISKAKSENKIIFLDAYTSWCGPCKSLQSKVFPDKKLGEYFNSNFINAKVDMEVGEGPALGLKYPVRGYPTLLFIDPKSGNIVNQFLGYRSIEQLMQLGEQVQKNKKPAI